jgi:hypothetical protein
MPNGFFRYNGVPRQHFKGDDGRVHEVKMQGNLLEWKVLAEPTSNPDPKGRGCIMQFSRASRLRMLKLIATIKWQEVEPCLFITLTFPDDRRPRTPAEVTQRRSVFWRYLEKYLGRQAPCLWRTEWEPRLSGQHVCEFAPHFHIMLFGVPYIHYSLVNLWWRNALDYQEYTRTECKGMENARQAAYYIAAYCAKLPSYSLVYASYLNSGSGRHWGTLRPELIPRHEQATFRFETSYQAALAKEMVADLSKYASEAGNGSFTVFSDEVSELVAHFTNLGLTRTK